jgi:hypothetical protein
MGFNSAFKGFKIYVDCLYYYKLLYTPAAGFPSATVFMMLNPRFYKKYGAPNTVLSRTVTFCYPYLPTAMICISLQISHIIG